VSELTADPDCDLCEAARYTHWYYDDDVCWVADCEICSTPMVVWRNHGICPSAEAIAHMLTRLGEAALVRFGEASYFVDRNMRQIPDHFHAHARDDGWRDRRWVEPMSRYTGVGTSRKTL
jgi:hypothetical protein